ncbi:MAG: SDR family NAD(P)-dependent oxidoreductase [Deltaproteobacteria bacterium]|nr:SDR family NAD(P)-dependent oxidoreductase [Deltaproteobacteria bacterium]MCL5277270.1 SDR family NAD(P)-dependent oxidoreductase [Deltaproteobacteria bacterium]
MKLNDKVVLLTGASGGIGSALAGLLVKKGARLALMARNIKRLNGLREDLGGNVIVVAGDVGDESDAEKAVQETIGRFKRLDVLINNAGVAYYGSIERMNMKSFGIMMKTNVHGVINMIQRSLPYLKKTKGMIVNISSVAGRRAIPMLGAYSGSKSMVDAISDALRVEVMGYGIKVLNFCPPEVDTGFAKNAFKESGVDFEAQKGIRRIMTLKPGRVAGMIAKGIEKEKREVVAMKSVQPVNYLMPGVLDRLFYQFIMKPYWNRYS